MRALPCTLILLHGATVLAQPAPEPASGAATLSVTRDAGAEACPDAQTLLARVAQLRAQAAPAHGVGYDVRYSRGPEGFAAFIRAREGGGERVLRDPAPTCAALGEATAVTLALLLDGSARGTQETDTSRAAEGTPTRDHETGDDDGDGDEKEEDAGGATRAHAVFALGGGGVAFVLRPLAPAMIAEAGVALARVQLGLGALWIPRQEIAHGPGALHESLLSGAARACLLAVRGAALRMQLCSGVYVGVLQARAESYTRNDDASKLWLGVPLELAVGSTSGPLGWELGAAALAPLVRHDFSIDGVGVAYESLPVGLLVSLRATSAFAL